MSFDEYLQGLFEFYFKLSDKAKKRRRQKLLSGEATARLADLQERLTYLARAVSGRPVRIYPAEREGGYKGNRFFLPEFFTAFPSADDNRMFYLFRTLYLSYMQKAGIRYPSGTEKSLAEARADALKAAPQVLEALFADFPSLRDFHRKLTAYYTAAAKGAEPDLSFVYGKLMSGPAAEPDLTDPSVEKIRQALEDEIQSMRQARAVEEMQVQQVDKKQQEDQVVHNYFEKIETAEEHTGGIWRDFDGSDEMDEHQNALDNLQMRHVVRTDEETHSVYQTEFTENTAVPEAADAEFRQPYILYDEWDYASQTYKKDYCKLFTEEPPSADPDYYVQTLRDNQTVLNGLRKILANLRNRLTETRRQYDGEHFDIDALTDWFTDIRSGHTPDERVYIAKRTTEKDVSVMLLLDISMSSDGYAAGNRIIDVEKQTAILFGEILHEFQTDFAIHAFYSKTRNKSMFVRLKDFDEKWPQAAGKIAAIQPKGYTRIGTALRHAGSLLRERPTRDKWLILLSDGKPNDYDRYEGRYGMEDIKQALRELRRERIYTYALAIEAQAKFYLPRMFGTNRYQILTSPVELLKSLVKLYEIIRYEK